MYRRRNKRDARRTEAGDDRVEHAEIHGGHKDQLVVLAACPIRGAAKAARLAAPALTDIPQMLGMRGDSQPLAFPWQQNLSATSPDDGRSVGSPAW